MINKIFNLTADLLSKTAQRLHLTYNEVNVIVYYMIVPLTWAVMLDIIIHSWPLLTVSWVILCLFVIWWHRKDFSLWCDDVFMKSVDFLLWFRCIGWDYNTASVIICVIIPMLIYITLGILL